MTKKGVRKRGADSGYQFPRMTTPPVYRQNRTHLVIYSKRGKPVYFSLLQEKVFRKKYR